MQALLHIDLFSAACNDSVYYTHSVLFISIYVNRYFFLSFRRFEELDECGFCHPNPLYLYEVNCKREGVSASKYLDTIPKLSLQFWFSLVYTRKPLHARYIFLLDLFVNKTTKLCKNTDNTGVQCIHGLL